MRFYAIYAEFFFIIYPVYADFMQNLFRTKSLRLRALKMFCHMYAGFTQLCKVMKFYAVLLQFLCRIFILCTFYAKASKIDKLHHDLFAQSSLLMIAVFPNNPGPDLLTMFASICDFLVQVVNGCLNVS